MIPHRLVSLSLRRRVRRAVPLALCAALALMLLVPAALRAQRVAVKTNLLYWATTTPNMGAELALGRRHTLSLHYGLNPWSHTRPDGTVRQLRHWQLQPEWRWWPCQKFAGHFLGVHATGGEFNMGGVDLPFGLWSKLETHRYEGWNLGAGLTYGYQWVLARHWNLEASLGVGYSYIKYKDFSCHECGERHADGHRNYFGPTKAALSVMYVF